MKIWLQALMWSSTKTQMSLNLEYYDFFQNLSKFRFDGALVLSSPR